MAKTCRGCGESKGEARFHADRHTRDGRASRCTDCKRAYRNSRVEQRRAYNKAWAAANPERIREKSRRWRARHPEKVREQNQRYKRANPETVSFLKRDWERRNPEAARAIGARRRQNPQYRIEATIRARVHRTLTRGRKNAPTFIMLGYSVSDLREHLERRFLPGMTWQNYGQWHIDHVRPLSSFAYDSPNDPAFRNAWALTNLQPLWAADNIRKHARMPEPTERVA